MNKGIKHIFAVTSGITVLTIYISTLHPGVGFMDTGELAAACYTFGVPHPTGYPLFLLIGYVVSHLPQPGSVIYRLNLMSAIESSSAVVITFYAVVFLLERLIPAFLKKMKNPTVKKEARTDQPVSQFNIYLIALFTSAAAGMTKTWWFNATQVEVYALHSLFISIIIYLSLKIILDINKLSRKYWALLFLFLGLSAANHSTTIFFIPGVVYLYYLQYKANKQFARSILAYLLLILPGLGLYLILIIAASTKPYLNWSDPVTLNGLLNHLRGSDFSQLMFSSSSNFSKNAGSFFSELAGEMALIPGLLGVLGFVLLRKYNKNIFVFALLIVLSCLFYSFNYRIIDIQSYYLIVYYFLAFSSSVGLVFLFTSVGRKPVLRTAKINPAVVLSGLTMIAFSLGFNFEENDNSTNYVNEDITINTLNLLEQNSILLTYDFPFVYSASLYLQQVEKLRPDVKVFNVKFLSAPWYLESIRKYYPDVYQTIQAGVDEYIRTYNVNDRNHPVRLTNFVKIFFDKITANFPVNLSADCILSKELSVLLSSYLAVPIGLVYRLEEKGAKYDPDAGKLSLGMSFRKYEPIGYHKNKMYVTVPGVYYETAFYHYKNKNYETSLKFLEKSLEFSRNFKDAVALKNKIDSETIKQ